jgi:hypothetical protein
LQIVKAKSVLFLLIVTLLPAISLSNATAQSNSVILGYSGTGISSDLRRVLEIEKNLGKKRPQRQVNLF